MIIFQSMENQKGLFAIMELSSLQKIDLIQNPNNLFLYTSPSRKHGGKDTPRTIKVFPFPRRRKT